MTDEECLFCRIAGGRESADIVHEEEHVVAFKDKYPRAPVHVLVVPRMHLTSAHEIGDEHADVLLQCFRVAQQVAEGSEVDDGYRIATSIGPEGGQTILHLHFHVLGGKQLGPPDGT